MIDRPMPMPIGSTHRAESLSAQPFREPRNCDTNRRLLWNTPRVVIRLADGVHWPPACFIAAAVDALRSDIHEPVIFLTDSSRRHDAIALVANHSRLVDSQIIELSNPSGGQLSSAMVNATRALWVDHSARIPAPPHRRPYEMVWTWCPPSPSAHTGGTRCEDFLAAAISDFEVQAMPASSSPADHDASSCARQVLVRSRWTRSGHWIEWAPPADSLFRRRQNFMSGEWAIDDACLAHSPRSPATLAHRGAPWRDVQRFDLLAQGHAASRQLLHPLPWPDLYAEYDPGYTRLDSEKLSPGHSMGAWTSPRVGGDRPNPARECHWHNDTIFLGELSMDNIFHSLIHAVPTYEFYARLRRQHRNGGDSKGPFPVPHFLMYWPGKSEESATAHYVGWQLTARSLGISGAEWKDAARRMTDLTSNRARSCHCYKRVYGGHRSFMPPPWSPVDEAQARVATFRSALASNVFLGAANEMRARPRVLFQLRHNGARQIVNEIEFKNEIQADPRLQGVVLFAVMEELPVIEQYKLIVTSTSLAGVHGMGLAWTMLLPSDSRGLSSCLEVTGMWPSYHRMDYYMLSRANGVYYLRMQQPTSPECLCVGCHYRGCGNLTANATQVAPVLRWMVRRFDLDRPHQQESRGSVTEVEDSRPPPRGCHSVQGDPKDSRSRACPDYLWPTGGDRELVHVQKPKPIKAPGGKGGVPRPGQGTGPSGSV